MHEHTRKTVFTYPEDDRVRGGLLESGIGPEHSMTVQATKDFIDICAATGAEAFIIDALADALIEAVCDAAEEEISLGLDTTGRFSPGYGDLELSLGCEILTLCDAERLLGIKMTESALMVPKKSVSAIIAIKDNVNEYN
jgi:hypothetical protein